MLYLHVGTHKTGTTSFQQCMVDHRAHFIRHGILPQIEQVGEASGNSMKFAHSILRNSLQTIVRIAGFQSRRSRFDVITRAMETRAALRAKPDHACLISSEALCYLRTFEEAMLLRIFATIIRATIVPIIVFRNDADWRASWKSQLGKTPQLAEQLKDQNFPLLQDWYFDREAIIQFWSRLGTPVIVDYDEMTRAGSDIIESMFSIFDVPLPPGACYRLNARKPLAENLV